MAENWKWNRPEQPGLESPFFLFDPQTYIGGGSAGLISKLASRGAQKAVLTKGLNEVLGSKGWTYQFSGKEPYSKLAKGLNDLMENAGWSYRIKP